MRRSFRKISSSPRTPAEYFQGDSALLACWPLRESGMDVVGGNHFNLTNVIFSEGMAYFNGTNASGVTRNNVVLTGTNKVTLIADVKVHTYGLTAAQTFFELSTNAASAVSRCFWSIIDGTGAGDPLNMIVRADGGVNQAWYLPSLTNLVDKNKHTLAHTYDFSLTTNEVNLLLDGYPVTPSSRPANANNTGNFASQPLYIGARASASAFSNISVGNVALLTRSISTDENADYNAWKDDKRRSNFVSLSSSMAILVNKFSPASQFPKLVINNSDDTGLVVADLSHGPDKNTIAEVRRMEKFNN